MKKSTFKDNMRYDESPKKKIAELSKDAILNAIPVDARDGLVNINKPDGSFGEYTWYVKFAPFSKDEAKVAADGITKSTGRKTTVASAGREVFVLVMDYPTKGMAQESRAKPTLLTDKEVAVIDKIVDESKVDWFALVTGRLGGWFVNDLDNKIQISVKDGLDELCQGACNDDWQELFGLTTEDVRVWNKLVDKLGLNPSYKVEDKGISKKLVKEGAGAGYTVRIKDLKFGDIKEKKLVKGKKRYDDYYVCKVEILSGEYEIEAEDYYNDFFWRVHELEEIQTAKIDGGVATIEYSTNSYDEEESEDELRREISNMKLDISFDYGHGWIHADLPKDGLIESDKVDVENSEFYGYIDKIELNAPDLADAVNAGHQSVYDRDEEDEDDADKEDVVTESYNDDWISVGVAFDEFRARLWRYTRKDRENRMEFFQDCMKKCEEGYKLYYDACVAED